MKKVKDSQKRWKQLVTMLLVAALLVTGTPDVVGFASEGTQEQVTAAAEQSQKTQEKAQKESVQEETVVQDHEQMSEEAGGQQSSSSHSDTAVKEENTEKERSAAGTTERSERGNPAIVSGISGIELAQEIIMYAYMNYKFPEKIFSEERSEVYWTGWALAEYQWDTCRRFKDIFSRIPLSEIVTMYSVYHEMDIGHFIEDMNKKYMSVTQEIHLKTIRENRGISQVELAALSGVKLRSIQMYEQKVNDIDKAQVRTLYKLSRVLGCSIEDLLENPEL